MGSNDPVERIHQLEWEVEKLSDIKVVDGIGKEELIKLRAPTKDDEIEWRIQSSGKTNGKIWARIIPYIDARAVMDRLDHCVGPHRWQDSYSETKNGFLCTISIYTKNGWVSKSDGADNTNIEPAKGGISGAFKRAGSRWGIGRDLYSYGSEAAEVFEKQADDYSLNWAKTKEGDSFYWRRRKTRL